MACFRYASASTLLGGRLDGASMPFAEPGVEPNYAPSWTFRITHAHVRLRLDPADKAYEGQTRFTLRKLPAFDGRYRFDLDGVEVLSVKDGEGNEPEFVLEDAAVVVHSDATELTLRYRADAPSAGLYFTEATESRDAMAWTQCQDEDAHFFMPCLDHPRIKHPWTIELEGPAGCTLVSNGALVEHREEGGRTHARFEQAEPMPVYLFNAIAAPLECVETTWRDLSVRYLVPRGRSGDIERAFGRTPEMMEVFSKRTGVDYPWPRYDQIVVHDFIFGGMENVAATTMTEVLLVDERVGRHWDPDGLVCHELAHQWFGDLVTCQDWSQAWLNESFATFMETVWFDHATPGAEATWYAFGHHRQYLTEDGGRYRRPITSYLFREPIDLFDRHLYEKGSVVLRTLRAELGEEAFWAGVQLYLERHAHGTVHGRDLQKAMEDATGANLDRFIHQWILGAGHPSVDVSLEQEDGLVVVKVEQTQSGDKVADAFHFGLRLELVTDEGTTRVTLPVRERSRAWALPCTGRVKTVRVDPGFSVCAVLRLDAPQAWLAELSQDDCPVLAARGLAALAKRNRRATIAHVAKALTEHPFWGVRAEAARLLAARGGDDAEGWLVAALSTETESRARTAIATALGSFRTAASADALIALLAESGHHWHLIGAALISLGKTRDTRAVDAITPFLSQDSWGDLVRQKAAMGLAQTRVAEVMPAILEVAGASSRAQAGAASALGVLGSHVDAVRTPVREALEGIIDAGGFRAQMSAIAALGVLVDTDSLPKLERLHATAPDGRMRRMAYEASVKVRKGRTSEEGLAGLHGRLERLNEEQRRLRARLEKLEG